ncbi:hypothetical protein [Neptunitalea lumnitzerae]|uniref:Uncharacterized protein n=1 Tax=Neptunitalea lumnitzerae TaxID=2965509 RepID=A0ABQ5MM68_9FLAO|nr:hypothetical protein [Neptunitalea sp. Y10]GLB50464.1 hypothetical protein Y10_28320 [Neptunitalea sp. Y10]
MYTIENYYEDDFLIEDLLDDDLLDLDEDLLDEDFDDDPFEDYGEDFAERRRRSRRRRRGRISPKYPRSAKTRSNFGKGVSSGNTSYVKKAELKKSLDAISKAVNAVKKSALVNGKALKSLDGKYNDFVKDLARKDANQTKVLKNMQTMNMMGTLLNKPKFNEENLTIDRTKTEQGETLVIKETADNQTVTYDQTMSLLLPMLTTMGDAKSGKSSSSDMMLPLVLLMSQNNSGSSDTNNTLLPLMLVMMNK